MNRIIATLIVALVTFGTAFGECTVADKTALEAFDRSWGKASENGDRAALMNLYSDSYSGMPEMDNKATVVAGTMALYESNKANNVIPDPITHDRYMISCTANTATITHRNAVTTTSATTGRPETLWTRSVHFLEKNGGKWQVVSNATHNMDDYMVLTYMEQDWNDANLKKDKAWFEKNFAPDFLSVSSTSGKLYNKTSDIASTISDKGTVELTETTDVDVRIDRNFAIVTGIYRWKGKDEKGVAYDNRIRYIDTFVKRNGQWLAWASAGSFIK